MSTLYASFADTSAAERAAGALLDHGARPEDISLLSNDRSAALRGSPEATDAEHAAKSGFSTTTPGDVAAGTVKGTMVGIGVGALAALASLFIPGIGLVVGGGAVATALFGAAGTTLAGAAAGSVAGLLKDQGVPEEMAARYTGTFEEGGAILALAVPTGEVGASDAESILAKYGASNVATYNAPRFLSEGVDPAPSEPLVIQPSNQDIGPIAMAAPVVGVPIAVTEPVATRTIIDQVTGAAVTEIAPPPTIEVIDHAAGVVIERPVAEQATTLPPTNEIVVDAGGTLHQTVGHSTTVNETPTVVSDPETGLPRAATIVEEQRAVVKEPLTVDEHGNPIESLASETIVTRDKRIELH